MKILKTTYITNSIIENFNKLRIKAVSETTPITKSIPLWELEYHNKNVNGKVVYSGDISIDPKTRIYIKDNKVEKVCKPFFTPWKKALNNVNNMLDQMLKNFNDKKTVEQNTTHLLF